jgi:hypothetical protein
MQALGRISTAALSGLTLATPRRRLPVAVTVHPGATATDHTLFLSSKREKTVQLSAAV